MRPIYTFQLIVFTCLLFTSCSEKKDEECQGDDCREEENWYSVRDIDENTWIFSENLSSQDNVCYLIAGSDRAIMYDGGTGENKGQEGSKMMYKIKETTDVPVTLLLSHFHFDHNQNIDEFEEVAFPDLDFLRTAVDSENVYHFTEKDLFAGTLPSSVEVTEWLPLETDIDLGGRTIQLVNLPGHTDESVVMIDYDNKYVFMGDFIYNGTLFVFDENDLEVYVTSLEKLISLVDESYVFFGAHGTPGVAYSRLTNALSLFECITTSDCYEANTGVVFGKQSTQYTALDGSASVLLFH